MSIPRRRRHGQWTAEQWAPALLEAEVVTPTQWMASEAAVVSTGWRFAPASWQTTHRSLLDGTYGSTAHAAHVVGPADYLYFTHDDGTGTFVGHDPGTTILALAGLTPHEVQLPAGNTGAPGVAALAVPALEAFEGVLAVVDNEDGTVTVQGLADGDLTTGTAFADRSGGGTMGVPVDEIVAGDGGTGGLNDLYLSRLVVPSTPGTGPRLPRTLRVWVHSVDLGDAPRVSVWHGDGTAPTTLAHSFGPLPVADISAPGWVDLHFPVDFADTWDGGDYLYLLIKSEANATVFRFMGSGSGLRGDWDGTFALQATDGTMSGDATVEFEATWSGGLTGSVAPVIFPAQIVWADTDAPAGDAGLTRLWGSPRDTPIGDFPNVTVLPGSIVHMVAPPPPILGLRLGAGHVGLGAHTTTGSMHVEFWTGPQALLDATFPHNPLTDGLEVVHDYGAEESLSPTAWYDFPEPEEPVYLDSDLAWAISLHADGVALTEIRFELTGTGMASTMNNRELAFDWYPVDGLAAGAGSEVEAYDPSAPAPPRAGDGNATIVINPALPAVTPHTQDVDDIWQGNCPALGVTLILDGMGPV
jgi:hypothetical protein